VFGRVSEATNDPAGVCMLESNSQTDAGTNVSPGCVARLQGVE